MKRLLLTTVSALALVSARPALAADLGRMPVKAAPPAPVRVFSWTGCYLGGHAGWGWGRTELNDPSTVFPDAGLATAFANAPSVKIDTDGFLGGGQLGCDYQFAGNWVAGVEGQFSWADIDGNAIGIASAVVIVPPALRSSTFHSRTDWLASVTGRLGYAWDRWLVYAKAGGAWAHNKYDVVTTYSGTWAASETRSGWTVGGGLEWAFADNWSAKLEYQFYDFGSRDVNFFSPNPEPFGPNFGNRIEDVDQHIHTVKLGINYRFRWQ
jgi:outer membrane immunogenic protein